MADDNSSKQGGFWDTGEPVKRCRLCREIKPIENFVLESAGRGRRARRRTVCRPCYSLRYKEYRRANPEAMATYAKRHRVKRLRREYGITVCDYDALLMKQGGVCAICKRSETHRNGRTKDNRPVRLAVDHDHITGKVRGLLCRDCNIMLGLAKDCPNRLQQAIAYLAKQQLSPVGGD